MSLSTYTTPSGSFLHLTAGAHCYNLNRFLVTFNPLYATFLHVRSHLLLHLRWNWSASVRQQPNPTTQSIVIGHWIRLILTYARHRKLFVLRVEDSETTGSDWEEILHNERINRKRVLFTNKTRFLNYWHKEIIRKGATTILVWYARSHGRQKCCCIWTSEANESGFGLLATAWRMGWSSLWLGMSKKKKNFFLII